MTRGSTIITLVLAGALTACVGQAPGDQGGDPGGDPAGPDAAPGSPDAADPVAARCDTNVQIPLGPGRAVDIIASDELARVAARMPCVTDPALRSLLESTGTLWYDHASIVPGYQDSFGDNVIAPIGMRPNSIRSSLIDTAVPGGHAQIFRERGIFHFPFGDPIGADADDVLVVNFWRPPSDQGAVLPVVWWMREPNDLTHRIEWLFPVGTVLGEMMFMVHDGVLWPFEIRTRTRQVDRWTVDAYRPFPTAADLADALADKRADRPSWASDPEITALVDHLRDGSTLEPTTLAADHFASAFPALSGAVDSLPPLSDPSILQELLLEVPFRSARNAVWKASGNLRTYAATTSPGSFSIVPADYNGGLIEVDDGACSRCHADAGRPFRDWYDNILAYGELWGGDESFSWHPFANETFVDGSGNVVDFNYDNRTFRRDFIDAGLLVEYDQGTHGEDRYKIIPRDWTGFVY